MSDKSNSVIILRSYWESIKDLPDDKQLLFLKSIIEYGMDSIEPEFNGVDKSFWIQIKTTIDNSMKRYNTSIENGKKGGAPKGNNNANKQPKTTQEQPKTTQEQPKTRVDNLYKDKDKDKDKDKYKEHKPIGGFEKLLQVFPTTKVYSEHECLAIWDSLTQEEKQKVIKHSSVYVKELTKKNEIQFMKNLKSYLESRIWENVSSSTKKKDLGRAMTKGGIDGKFVQWVSRQTKGTFDESVKELALMSDDDYNEIRTIYEGETQNG